MNKISPYNQRTGGFSVVIVAIIAAVIALVGGTTYLATQKSQSKNKNVPTQQQSNQPTASSANVDGWKVYRDEKNGFEFKYPPGWKVTDIFKTLGGKENAVALVEIGREQELENRLIPGSDVGSVVIQDSALFIAPLSGRAWFENNNLVQTSKILIGNRTVNYSFYSSAIDPNKFAGGSTEYYVFRSQDGTAVTAEANYYAATPNLELQAKYRKILETLRLI